MSEKRFLGSTKLGRLKQHHQFLFWMIAVLLLIGVLLLLLGQWYKQSWLDKLATVALTIGLLELIHQLAFADDIVVHIRQETERAVDQHFRKLEQMVTVGGHNVRDLLSRLCNDDALFNIIAPIIAKTHQFEYYGAWLSHPDLVLRSISSALELQHAVISIADPRASFVCNPDPASKFQTGAGERIRRTFLELRTLLERCPSIANKLEVRLSSRRPSVSVFHCDGHFFVSYYVHHAGHSLGPKIWYYDPPDDVRRQFDYPCDIDTSISQVLSLDFIRRYDSNWNYDQFLAKLTESLNPTMS